MAQPPAAHYSSNCPLIDAVSVSQAADAPCAQKAGKWMKCVYRTSLVTRRIILSLPKNSNVTIGRSSSGDSMNPKAQWFSMTVVEAPLCLGRMAPTPKGVQLQASKFIFP